MLKRKLYDAAFSLESNAGRIFQTIDDLQYDAITDEAAQSLLGDLARLRQYADEIEALIKPLIAATVAHAHWRVPK